VYSVSRWNFIFPAPWVWCFSRIRELGHVAMKIQAGCCRSRVMLRSSGGVPDGREAKLNFSRKEAESPHLAGEVKRRSPILAWSLKAPTKLGRKHCVRDDALLCTSVHPLSPLRNRIIRFTGAGYPPARLIHANHKKGANERKTSRWGGQGEARGIRGSRSRGLAFKRDINLSRSYLVHPFLDVWNTCRITLVPYV